MDVRARLTSLREISWARFEPNFYAVFQPAALQAAPKQFALLANVPSDDAIARLQRDVVTRYPNVASIDLSLVQRTVGRIVDRVGTAVRFLGAFCLAMGIPVLFSAVAATRRDRVRDAVLLKTLGATRGQITRILLAEYTALGVLGASAGMVLSFGGAWGLARWIFHQPFHPDWAQRSGWRRFWWSSRWRSGCSPDGMPTGDAGRRAARAVTAAGASRPNREGPEFTGSAFR